MNINHIAMYVDDLEGAKSFFEKYFGAKANTLYHNKTSGLRTYFLSFNGGAKLEIMNKPPMSSRENQFTQKGYNHIAFSVGSKEKVDELTSILQSDGYELIREPRITGDGYYESCIVCFEGNLIEITE